MYAVKPELGIIEGYFGRMWSWEARAEVVRTLGPAGYRFFHYAPKIETHLRRDWQTPFPANSEGEIRNFAQTCRAQGVRFGIGLTPYGAHLDFNAETRAALVAKLKQLDALGIEDLAVLFDDMRGDFDDLADRQAEIVAVCLDNSRATRFFMCPSYYSNDPVLDRVFGRRPSDYLATLGRKIDPGVAFYWTGEEVCSAEYSLGHLSDIEAELGRKFALWDNYPVNDGPRMSQHLHLRAFTGRPATMGKYVTHHAINPASQPILGCIPALTLPMVYRQGDDYRYGTALQSAAEAICGPELGNMLIADILSLQNSGLDRLGDRRQKFLDKYCKIDHAAAREVVDWLNDGYAITGEMLATQ